MSSPLQCEHFLTVQTESSPQCPIVTESEIRSFPCLIQLYGSRFGPGFKQERSRDLTPHRRHHARRCNCNKVEAGSAVIQRQKFGVLMHHENRIVSQLSSPRISLQACLKLLINNKLIRLPITVFPNTSHLLIPFIVMNLVNRVIRTTSVKGVKMIQTALYFNFHWNDDLVR